MGERALAVCRLPDGTEDVYYSQWAGDESVIARVLETECFESQCQILKACDWQHNRMQPTLSAIDYLTTAVVYVISSDGVSPYAVRWFGLPQTGGPTAPKLGALVRLDDHHVRERRMQFQQCKSLLQDATVRGYISTEVAIRILLLSLEDSEYYPSPACKRFAEGL